MRLEFKNPCFPAKLPPFLDFQRLNLNRCNGKVTAVFKKEANFDIFRGQSGAKMDFLETKLKTWPVRCRLFF